MVSRGTLTCVAPFLKALSIKVEPEETVEAKTHNLRRRMGCPTPKCENGEKMCLKWEPSNRNISKDNRR